MANIKQQKKRDLQNERNRSKNSQVKSAIRTTAKKIVKAIDSKEAKDPVQLQESLKNFIKTIDTAASRGVIKKTTAARKKSRLARKVNAVVASNN